MKIEYIAFDSFGVKSSCIRVVTKDVSVVVDPGVAIETGSFPVSLAERLLLVTKYEKKIKKACKKSDVLVITHYHYDHYLPDAKSIYKDKILLIKDPNKKINRSQKERSRNFLENIGKLPAEIKVVDGKEIKFGKTKIKFSKPVWHGKAGTPLGYVLIVTIDDGKERLVFSSDLNGVYLKTQARYIIQEKPSILILDGAPTYLLGYVMSFRNLEKCVKNTIKILENTNCRKYIIDHHLLRDYRYKELYYEAFKKAKELKKTLCTAAEESGKKPKVITAYNKKGPTKWKKWENLTWEKFKEIEIHARNVALRKRKKRK